MERFNNVLCVVDPGRPAGALLERAFSLARNNQAQLTIVAVEPRLTAGIGMPEGGPISAELQQARAADTLQQLERAVASFRSGVTVGIKLLTGTVFLEVVREVLRNVHDLVIKAPEDPDWIDRLFGSDDMHLLRKCPCPVWLVKHSRPTPCRRVLAAVDVDADHPSPELAVRHALNVKILELAVSLALADFAELHVAHAWTAVGESALRGALLRHPDSEVDTYVERVRQQHERDLDDLLREVTDTRSGDAVRYLSPQRHLVKGAPQKEIPQLASNLEVDVVVMGTVARTGVPGFIIGNTAEAILEQLDCSVLAVKPEGFVTPVTLD
jgi:nucleotide-binding universal stress UspA family protein